MNPAIMERGYVTPNDVYGATDAEAIQNAVELSRSLGLGKVVIPRYNKRTGLCIWEFDAPVLLHSGITVVLDNCYLRMKDDVYANFFRTANIYTENGLDTTAEYREIHIQGIGTAVLEGGRANDLSELTQYKDGHPAAKYNTPILFFNVRYFSVENLLIRDQRYWGLCFQYCKCGTVRNIRFDTSGDRRNQDGVNLRNGCSDILIENLYGQTCDDMVALSAIDTPRTDKYNVAVSEWDNDIHHVTIRNISGWALDHPLIALRNHNGARLYAITIDNIRDTAAVRDCPKASWKKYAMIRIGNNAYFHTRPSVLGETRDITVSNLYCSTSERAVTVSATLKNAQFSHITCRGRCEAVLSINPKAWAGGCSGAQLEDVTVENVYFAPDAEKMESAAIDFDDQRPEDFIRNLTVRDMTVEGAAHLAALSGDAQVKFENVTLRNLTGEAVKVRAGDEERVQVSL